MSMRIMPRRLCHAPEVVPRDEAEAGAPDPVALEATVSLVAAEDVSADVDSSFAALAVGLRTDFEVDRLPEAFASAPPVPANLEEPWLA